MHRIQTKYFGELDYSPDAVLEFPLGIPGFDTERRFVVLDQPASRPLAFLQSLTRPDLCFVTLPIASIEPHYRLNSSPEDLETIGLAPDRQPNIGRDVLCLAIVSFADSDGPSANLLSPILVNLRTRAAIQAIQRESDYSYRQPLASLSEAQSC
jgi:flagellar assembly factor FliW